MKNFKAFLALGLSVCMLAACGSQPVEEESKVQENVQNASSGSDDVSQEVQSESIYPEYLNLESARPIVKEGEEVTISVALARGNQDVPIEDTWIVHFIEEKLNINLEIIELTREILSQLPKRINL